MPRTITKEMQTMILKEVRELEHLNTNWLPTMAEAKELIDKIDENYSFILWICKSSDALYIPDDKKEVYDFLMNVIKENTTEDVNTEEANTEEVTDA